MLEPLTDADWTKLRNRLELHRKTRKSFDISFPTAERLFADIGAVRDDAKKAANRADAAVGHMEQAAKERDAAYEHAEKLLSEIAVLKTRLANAEIKFRTATS